MKYCPNCHTNQPESANYCSGCGAAMAVSDSFMMETIQMDGSILQKATANAKNETMAAEPAAEPAAPAHDTRENFAKKETTCKKIEANIVKAVITLCCCFPFGIFAFMYTLKVRSKIKEKDYDAALEVYEKANIWGNLAIAVGIVWIVYYIIYTAITFNEKWGGGF